MKTKSQIELLLILVCVASLALIAAIPAGAQPSPWTGTWWSIDPYDGSLQKVVFGGGGQGHFVYTDFGAGVCGKDADGTPLYAAQAKGWAEAVDNTSFTGSAPIVCMTHPPFTWSESWSFTWSYDPTTKTLWDGSGTWTRTKKP